MSDLHPPPCYSGLDLDSDRMFRLVSSLTTMFILCGVIYTQADRILTKRSIVYRKMSKEDKADCCTRFYSNMHALIVPIGHIWTMRSCGIIGDFWSTNCPNQEYVFGLSIGYFLFDACMLLHTRMSLWQVFVIHHMVGILPFAMAFVPGFGKGYFTLGCGMIIELSNIWMNQMWWMEKYQMRDSRFYTCVCFINFGSWVLIRLSMLHWLAYNMFIRYVPAYGISCPSVWSHYMISLFLLPFCIYVFATLVVPDLLTQIRETKGRRERRKLRATASLSSKLPGTL